MGIWIQAKDGKFFNTDGIETLRVGLLENVLHITFTSGVADLITLADAESLQNAVKVIMGAMGNHGSEVIDISPFEPK